MQGRKQKQGSTEAHLYRKSANSKILNRKANKRKKNRRKCTKSSKNEELKSSTFWNIRKQLLNHNKNDAYEARDEEGKTIENTEMAKEHIADNFENLY